MGHDGVKMAMRNTFVVNPEGIIVRVYMEARPTGHSEQALRGLTVLKKS